MTIANTVTRLCRKGAGNAPDSKPRDLAVATRRATRSRANDLSGVLVSHRIARRYTADNLRNKQVTLVLGSPNLEPQASQESMD